MNTTKIETAAETLAVDVDGAERMTSLSKYTIRAYIRDGRLKVVRCGRRILIPIESLRELVEKGAPSRR